MTDQLIIPFPGVLVMPGGKGDDLEDLGGLFQEGMEVGSRVHEDGQPSDVENQVAVAVPLIRVAMHQGLVNIQHERVLWAEFFHINAWLTECHLQVNMKLM